MSLWKKIVANVTGTENAKERLEELFHNATKLGVSDGDELPPVPPAVDMKTIAAEVGEEQFAKWFDAFLQQDLGFNELDASEISTKVMKSIKAHYIPVLQKAVQAHHYGSFSGDS